SAARSLVYRRFVEAARIIPGVVLVGTVDALPFSGENHGGFLAAKSQDVADTKRQGGAEIDVIGAEYLHAIGARLAGSSWFDGAERDTAIVNDVAARRLWPGESAIGKRVCVWCTPEMPDQWKRVVAVVTTMRHWTLEGEAEAAAYLAADGMRAAQFLVIR